MGEVEHALLVLTPRPWKWLRVLLICALFVWGGWWMAHSATEAFKRGVGWFSLVFFGLGAVLSVIQLIPGTSRVVVTSQGIYVKSILRSYQYDLREIERFGVAEWTQWHGPFRQRHRYVGILFVEGSKHLSQPRLWRSWTRAFWGYHASLPDNYGYKHAELAELLNAYLEASRGQGT